MECIAVFSGRSAGKGKDGVGGGLSTLSGMAVVGHGDVLVSATYVLALNRCFNLPTAQWMWMAWLLTRRLQPSNHNLKFRDPPHQKNKSDNE